MMGVDTGGGKNIILEGGGEINIAFGPKFRPLNP
jgi:hypothetical protein